MPAVAHPRVLGSVRAQLLPGLFLFLVSSYFLLPLYWLAVSSTKTTGELFLTSGLWFGRELHLADNLHSLLRQEGGIFVRWLLNSVLYSGLGAAAAALLSAMAGYALAHFRFAGREAVFATILGAILVPGTALVLPLYLLMNAFGLVNTVWAVLLPSAVSPFGVYLSRIYAATSVPTDLVEAARIEGAGEGQIFRWVVLPLLSPALVTVFLFQFVAIWNNYFLALVMLSDQHLFPVTLGLQAWSVAPSNSTTEVFDVGRIILGSSLSILPTLIGFLLLQRYWRSGLTMGAIKA